MAGNGRIDYAADLGIEFQVTGKGVCETNSGVVEFAFAILRFELAGGGALLAAETE